MEFFKRVTRVPFMRHRRISYLASAIVIGGSLIALFVRGPEFGIDFTGGIVVEAGFRQDANLEQLRTAFAGAGLPEAQVQSFGTAADVLVRLPPAEGTQAKDLTERAANVLKSLDPAVEIKRTEAIGPQVGKELAEKGALALVMTMFLILLYVAIRFRWRFGVGATLAALHDPIAVVGFFVVTGMTFDLSVLAAILAVIGYSLNDTVVVFDRVRERFMTLRKATPEEVMDVAVNETLSRTIMTSGTTLLTVIALALLGGEALRGFSLALIVGIVVGTYSSIYIASAVALDLGASARDFLPPEKKSEADAMP
jgi:preprotein translocase subunit SecF